MEIFLQVKKINFIIFLKIIDRYGHTATVIRQNIRLFGGWEFGKALNDINILLAK